MPRLTLLNMHQSLASDQTLRFSLKGFRQRASLLIKPHTALGLFLITTPRQGGGNPSSL